jgi:hypothetical protein
MKPIFTIYILIFIASCKTINSSIDRNLSGDYSQREDSWGWQLRLYPDSTFFFENNINFEIYASWQGTWTLISTHPLLFKLIPYSYPEDTSIIPLPLEVDYTMLGTQKWRIEVLNGGLLKLEKNDSTDGPILRRGVLHGSNRDSEIYSLAHNLTR